MSFKYFLEKLLIGKIEDNTLKLPLALSGFLSKFNGATYQSKGQTFFDSRFLANPLLAYVSLKFLAFL